VIIYDYILKKNRAVKTSSISIWQDTFDEAAHYTAQLLEQEITTNTAPNSPVSPKDRRSRSLRNSVNMQSVLVRSRLDGAPEFIFTEQPKKKQKERDIFAFFSDGDEPEEPTEQKKMEEIESTIYQWYGGDKKKVKGIY